MLRLVSRCLKRRGIDTSATHVPSASAARPSHAQASPRLKLGTLFDVLAELIRSNDHGTALHVLESLAASEIADADLPCSQSSFEQHVRGLLDRRSTELTRSALVEIFQLRVEQASRSAVGAHSARSGGGRNSSRRSRAHQQTIDERQNSQTRDVPMAPPQASSSSQAAGSSQHPLVGNSPPSNQTSRSSTRDTGTICRRSHSGPEKWFGPISRSIIPERLVAGLRHAAKRRNLQPQHESKTTGVRGGHAGADRGVPRQAFAGERLPTVSSDGYPILAAVYTAQVQLGLVRDLGVDLDVEGSDVSQESEASDQGDWQGLPGALSTLDRFGPSSFGERWPTAEDYEF